jgi:hypothetical protein
MQFLEEYIEPIAQRFFTCLLALIFLLLLLFIMVLGKKFGDQIDLWKKNKACPQ